MRWVALFSTTLNQFRSENLPRIIIGHININSVRNKSESLVDLIRANLDVLMISETKINETLPESQFTIKDFQNFTIWLYSNSFESLFMELNLRNMEWLL